MQHAQLIAIASTLAAAVVVASYTDAVAFQGSGRAEFDVVSIKPTKTLPGGAIPLSQSFGAVSYTHLDVYKRQVWRRPGAFWSA